MCHSYLDGGNGGFQGLSRWQAAVGLDGESNHRRDGDRLNRLGKAIQYTLNQWDRPVVYLEAGFLKPDNNIAKNAIRPFVLGRKNWLFAGTPKGAHASATMFSLIETAKANGIEPDKYLRYVFEKLPAANTIIPSDELSLAA